VGSLPGLPLTVSSLAISNLSFHYLTEVAPQIGRPGPWNPVLPSFRDFCTGAGVSAFAQDSLPMDIAIARHGGPAPILLPGQRSVPSPVKLSAPFTSGFHGSLGSECSGARRSVLGLSPSQLVSDVVEWRGNALVFSLRVLRPI